MKKRGYVKKAVCLTMLCGMILGGCLPHFNKDEGQAVTKEDRIQETERVAEPSEMITEAMPEDSLQEPAIVQTDWSGYFDGLNGAAVVYDASAMQYQIYKPELAQTRRSPCSTFKIISSLIALESKIMDPDHAVRTWSGEVFWKETWNRDIGFYEAFRESCVWYFRELIDEIGPETMQRELDRLLYGNCDISDWEGLQNTNHHNRALTGFWIESSLAISPKEQTEVMERIFGEDSVYAKETKETLKQAMLVTDQNTADIPIYGKTGMGKTQGSVVDAWFTGFAEKKEGNVYFCVYLGRTDGQDVSSALAKEIAIKLITDGSVPES